jgi:alpha-1,3-glucosyltransferase
MFEIFAFTIILSIKFLLFPTYHSTDFEVHRNWKAITNSLPISDWYFYSDNKWTLDYPPLFAYMEYILGKISKLIDPNITNLQKINYDSSVCKFFMRSTVLIGDIVLFFSINFLYKSFNLSIRKYLILLISIQFYAGLVIVDNMHFQYNGILFGLFFISLGFIAKKKYVYGAIFYLICLCMKHIFIYFAPAYFIFYFQYVIINNIKKKKYKNLIANIILIGLGMSIVLLIAFLPFIAMSIKNKNFSQLIQIKNRLFPVQRGLLHTYWAPNFWALYSFVDKILYFAYNNFSTKIDLIRKFCEFLLKFKKNHNIEEKRNTSSLGASEDGVSQVTGFDILPDIDMKTTNVIIISFILIYYLKYFYMKVKNTKSKMKIKNSKIKEFIKHCIFSNLIFFNYGYQVHEKAFLNISILTLIYYIISNDVEEILINNGKRLVKKIKNFDTLKSLTSIIVTLGILAQLPLIHETSDYLVKIILMVSYTFIIKAIIFNNKDINSHFLLLMGNIIYMMYSLIIDFFITFQNDFDYNIDFPGIKELEDINENYPFLFLMIYSIFNGAFTQIIFIFLFIFKT